MRKEKPAKRKKAAPLERTRNSASGKRLEQREMMVEKKKSLVPRATDG